MKRPARMPDAPRRPLNVWRSWDVGVISHALDAAPTFVRHQQFGGGVRYGLGQGSSLTLDLFPPTTARRGGMVRLSTVDLDLLLFKQPMPAIAEDRLHFRTAHHVLTVTARGELALFQSVTP